MGGPGDLPSPPVSEVKTYLSLSDSQIQALQQLRKQQADGNSPIFDQMHQKQQALQDALSKSKDAAVIGQAMLDIEGLRKQIQDNDKRFHDLAVNSLTADQKTKLAKLEEAAKLDPAIQQATGLNLLTPPAGPSGTFNRMILGGPGRMPGMDRVLFIAAPMHHPPE